MHRTTWLKGGFAIVLMGVGLELFARVVLGMGDPPLVMADPEIEYLFRPSTTYRRFHRTVRYNQYSMRSEDFPETKTRPEELRVLVLGDSVINGGAVTDQSELATTLLQARLSDALDRPVLVANISAGSWGPPNLLAYVDRFGWFDADIAYVVVSSHDYADVPTFEVVGKHRNFPDRKPWLALGEALFRYVPKLLITARIRVSEGLGFPLEPPVPTSDEIERASSALVELLRRARDLGIDVTLVQHLDRRELGEWKLAGYPVIQEAAERAGARILPLGPTFADAEARGANPYRDNIHPSVAGQAVIASVLEQDVLARWGADARSPKGGSRPGHRETKD